MKKAPTERMLVKFSTPDSFMNTTVYRVLPDNSTEIIGRVYTDSSAGENSITYISTNNQGEEIFPPTTDFTDIGNYFEKYAKELSEKSFMEDIMAETEKSAEREESLKSIRNLKSREIQQINL